MQTEKLISTIYGILMTTKYLDKDVFFIDLFNLGYTGHPLSNFKIESTFLEIANILDLNIDEILMDLVSCTKLRMHDKTKSMETFIEILSDAHIRQRKGYQIVDILCNTLQLLDLITSNTDVLPLIAKVIGSWEPIDELSSTIRTLYHQKQTCKHSDDVKTHIREIHDKIKTNESYREAMTVILGTFLEELPSVINPHKNISDYLSKLTSTKKESERNCRA